MRYKQFGRYMLLLFCVSAFFVMFLLPYSASGGVVGTSQKLKNIQLSLYSATPLVEEEEKRKYVDRIMVQVNGASWINDDGYWCFKESETITFNDTAILYINGKKMEGSVKVEALNNLLDTKKCKTKLPVLIKIKNAAGKKYNLSVRDGQGYLSLPEPID